MQEATPDTVLADFDNTSFKYGNVTSRFYRRDGRFFVETDNAKGELQEFRVTYTFGVTPLQQYLVEFPDGRIQTLSLSWDTRPREQGGQRWFHLYPDEVVDHRDPLHWTGAYLNWNYMCAECHSTKVRRNYDAGTDRFRTTWQEINVSCEACHGPGAAHVQWARAVEGGQAEKTNPTRGLAVLLKELRGVTFEAGKATATMTGTRGSTPVLDSCARCHSRRRQLKETYVHGQPLAQTHRLSLLHETLYHPDGQILDEVYVYGSFLQSKMYAAGVSCLDCHDPHTARLIATRDQLCLKCHQASTFATPKHHFHSPKSAGASCVECHMPARTYMGVDVRRDHSFRIPRPDVTASTGSPNACNQCHTDKTTDWAFNAMKKWYGKESWPKHYGEVFHAGRQMAPNAADGLKRLLADPKQPEIVRATAAHLLGRNLTPGVLPVLRAAARDSNALVRDGVLGAAEALPPAQQWALAGNLLRDPVRSVRLEAARILAAPSAQVPPAHRAALNSATAELEAMLRRYIDRHEAMLELGVLYNRLGRDAEARESYEAAVRIAPFDVIGYVNLSDLHRQLGQDTQGERVLEAAIRVCYRKADARHALGLLYVRQRQYDKAMSLLKKAAADGPENSRFAYVYAVALDSRDRTAEAFGVLAKALTRHPHDRQILGLLAGLHDKRGEVEAALKYARRLRKLAPWDDGVLRYVEQLEGRQKAGEGEAPAEP